MVSRKTQAKSSKDTDARRVTFLNHQTGLFKKASETCTLCMLETAMVIFTPGGKAFSSCQTCADTVVNKLHCQEMSDSGSSQESQADQDKIYQSLKKRYAAAVQELESEKKRVLKIKQALDEDMVKVDQLIAYTKRVQLKRLAERAAQTPTSSSAAADQPFVAIQAEGGGGDPNGHGVGKGE